MQSTGLNPQQTFLFVNNHSSNANGTNPQSSVPRSFQDIDKQVGTCEDSSFVFSGFERFFSRCYRQMTEQQRNDEQ